MGLASLFPRPSPGPSASPSASHLTDAPPIERHEIGLAAQHLEREMLRMYWAGVARELPHILLTLARWQAPDFADAWLPDETDDLIHGYDTFLDQVSEGARRFADRNDAALPRARHDDHPPPPTSTAAPPGAPPSYAEALEDRGRDVLDDLQSADIKAQIRDALGHGGEASSSPSARLARRARMLLQSSQFLDIDKMIEYRPPETRVGFWKRPAPPQLVRRFDAARQAPVFAPRRCAECDEAIRGASFARVDDAAAAVCETCYRLRHFGDRAFTKRYKACCLHGDAHGDGDGDAGPGLARRLCHCPAVPRRDAHGAPRPLWPVDADTDGTRHLAGGHGKLRCALYDLPDRVAEAKYAATRTAVDRTTTLDDELRRAVRAARRFDLDDDAKYDAKHRARPPRPGLARAVHAPHASVAEYGRSYGCTDTAPEAIPVYLRPVTDRYPYGNVHMALRLGPLVIENGVANTHGGVLITSRDPPHLQVLRDDDPDVEHSLLVCGRDDRRVYAQRRPRAPKRYKAMMKQVAGGAFAGLFAEAREADIVDALLAESRRLRQRRDDGATALDEAALLRAATGRLLARLRDHLGPRAEAYIASVAARLVDPAVDLRWTPRANNCQAFCDSLLDTTLFGALLAVDRPADYATGRPLPSPLYLASFVCRPGAYVQARARSKFDVPNGLTEEYLLRFRYGRHDESDLVDSLAEYWHDWGAFEGPLYPYQDLFPWDCTEAFHRYPGRCGRCNVAKHVWAFPFDAWSLVALHLARGRPLYPRDAGAGPDDTGSGTGLMTDAAWFRNRLTVLLAHDVLLRAAVAMARCAPFRAATRWLSAPGADPARDRLKLGGIHRAQPFSHHFERGAFHQYFVAEWSHLTRPQRVRAYEALRDWKATRRDVGDDRPDDGAGGGGCGGFACGGVAAGCAAGCASGQDGCGSGCVSSCGGDGDAGCGSCGGGCGGG